MVLVKLPLPGPSLVFVDNDTVGFGDVLQTTPLCVMLAPPSSVTVPPQVAPLLVISSMDAVVTFGSSALVLKDRISPYDVPAEFLE